ncbi:hypothetical protein CPLU01_10788 [Colletotrichum plurivorum]|uniref:Uncharacterized protein n=1 Tax=Colletotrichum plurivorum TaxID=2175906 RepID=A0A8H6K4I1_9PEZI|nr:hypothetical protein CPLU01_10788 [Colletotrichum plurivorum]
MSSVRLYDNASWDGPKSQAMPGDQLHQAFLLRTFMQDTTAYGPEEGIVLDCYNPLGSETASGSVRVSEISATQNGTDFRVQSANG